MSQQMAKRIVGIFLGLALAAVLLYRFEPRPKTISSGVCSGAKTTGATPDSCQAEPVAAEENGIQVSETIARAMRKHCVRVKIWTQKDDGEAPSSHDFSNDLRGERPTLLGGYLWDAKTVLLRDMALHDRFIRKIEVESGGVSVPAVIHGYYTAVPGILLTLQKALPAAEPLCFATDVTADELERLHAVKYSYDNEGSWILNITPAPSQYNLTEKEGAFLWAEENALLVREDGMVAGVMMSSRLYLNTENATPWDIAAFQAANVLPHKAKKLKLAALAESMKQTALGVRFEFRAEVEAEENNGFSRRWSSGDEEESETESFATGILVGSNRLLAPSHLTREKIARIQSITVMIPQDGNETPPAIRKAKFVGALKDWFGILLDIEGEPLPGALSLPEKTLMRYDAMFLKANINYKLRERKERLAYDRFRGEFRTVHEVPGLFTYTNEDDGSLAFGLDGSLLAISLAQRTKPDGEDHYWREENSVFRPANVVRDLLTEENAIDLTMKPIEKEKEKLLVTLGVEWQPLDMNLAKAFKAEKETRGGTIGLLLLYIYPQSPASEAGLQPEDILLSVKAPGRAEPIDLKEGYSGRSMHGGFNFSGMPGGMQGSFYDRMPSPWPSRSNTLTELLTKLGEDKAITMEYLRKGKKYSFTFASRKGAPDFTSAAKYKSKSLGFSVKEITYEVLRFFRREKNGGVVISRVESGSKAMVGGMRPYALITHVNGAPVASFPSFRDTVKALSAQTGTSVEFTLEYMGKTRLVKIDL